MINLSICVTAHSEGVLLHKTLRSIQRATTLLDKGSVSYEIIVHCDNPNSATKEYVVKSSLIKEMGANVVESNFGDLASSRNKCVEIALGDFITFIDADDIMSENWLADAYFELKNRSLGEGTCKTIAHSELTVEFEGVKSVIIKHGSIDKQSDALLSVYANRWNSIIMVRREFLLSNKYEKNSLGYGYEDWNLNCRSIYLGMDNILIPKTAIFVRRKTENSEWARQQQNNNVLRRNPLLSFGNIRDFPLDQSPEPGKLTSISRKGKNFIKRSPLLTRGLNKVLIKNSNSSYTYPSWLKDEALMLHRIEKNIFPDVENHIFYDSLTPDHYAAGELYLKLVKQTSQNSYDYIFFVPWLLKGGADKYTIQFANKIKSLSPSCRICVISTLTIDSPWAQKLSDGIDFIPFGNLSGDYSSTVKNRVLEQFIENSDCRYIHVINSECGFNFIDSHRAYISGSEKKIIVSSFSESIDGSGKIFGYSHTHVPRIYDMTSLIITDNQAVCDMWEKEYGFDKLKLTVLRQEITPNTTRVTNKSKVDALKVLWAARISPEKIPHIVSEIGDLINKYPITIDMYGGIDKDYPGNEIKRLSGNVSYMGSFDDFKQLKPETYNVFLYTSLFDGMPNVLLEAGSYGLPIVSSNIGGISELLSSRNGILINNSRDATAYADALIKLYENQDELEILGNNIIKKITNDFSEAKYEKSVASILNKIGLSNA